MRYHVGTIACACLEPHIFDMPLDSTGRYGQFYGGFLSRKAKGNEVDNLCFAYS